MNDVYYESPIFPRYLFITDVATAGSPQQGLDDGAAGLYAFINQFGAGCPGSCVQASQIEASNPIMSNLNSTSFRNGWGRNPQGVWGQSGSTDWTNLSSDGDPVLSICPWGLDRRGGPIDNQAACGIMPGATHFVIYPGPTPWYLHGDYLTDPSNSWNANEVFSDNNGNGWTVTSTSNHSIMTMYSAILYSGW